MVEKDQALRSFVLDRLAEAWTPKQISGWLKVGNVRRLRWVGCETGRTTLALSHAPSQTPASAPIEALTRYDQRSVSINERPKTIDARTEAGHWEGDLIICKRTRPVLVLHERKSRVTLAARLIGKTAAETISVMLAVINRIPPTLRKTITLDDDTAFAQHGLLRIMRAMTTWFCDA